MPSPVNDGYTRVARATSNQNSGKGLIDVVLVCGGIRTVYLGQVATKQTTCLETISLPLEMAGGSSHDYDFTEPEGWYVDVEAGIVRCPQHRGIV